MPLPTLITELSTTAVSNYPSGSDSPATLDDVQRAHGAFIAQIRDGTVAVAGTGLTGTAPALSIGGNAATATNATNATNVTGTIASAVTATTQTAGDSTTKVATTAFVSTAIAANPGVPAGTVIHVAMSTAPSGYIKANGAAISRATYAALFSAIGTTFGAGDGSTTFVIPDLRGEFIRSWDDARGIDSGRAIGTAQADDYESHTHGIQIANTPASSGYTKVAGTDLTVQTTVQSGASGGTETRPRNIALLACIKY